MDGKPFNHQQLKTSVPSDKCINMHKINLAQAELFQESKQIWMATTKT